MNVIRLLRPHQWIKNVFVLVGLFFAHAWHNTAITNAVFLSFIAFCFMSSTVYIYNDIIDYPQDKLHPTKKHRPLASQKISVFTAVVVAILLFLFAISLSLSVSQKVTLILLTYLSLNIAYTHFLKHIVILDVFVISAGFMLRILAGTLGVNITPSPWIMFCGLMFTLFLGFTKRRAENMISKENYALSRKVLKEYNAIFLDKMIGITASCSIIGYGLYTMSPDTIQFHHTENLIYTLPLVTYAIFRYLYLLHNPAKSGGEDTAKDILTDLSLIVAVILWLLITLYMIS